jgi:release factor family 11
VEYKDIPTKADVERIAALRQPGCVSIYLPTGTTPAEADRARIELKNHLASAVRALEKLGVARARIQSIKTEGERILEDRNFWRYQSRSLAVFLDGDLAETFRLPNRLGTACEIADRFYVKPLLRALTFPQSANILALAGNSVRLLHITPDRPPERVDVPGMPHDVADAVGLNSVSGRAPDGRIQGSEGQKVRMLEYAQAIERALRPRLAESTEPLILAAAEPLASIFRGAGEHLRLVAETIGGNPEEKSDEELSVAARGVLDRLYAGKVAALRETYQARIAAGTALVDLSDIARAATFGAVESLVIDIERRVPGTIDDETGAISFAPEDEPGDYGVVDEIVRRVLGSKATVYALRGEDVPGGGAAAAAVRYPV